MAIRSARRRLVPRLTSRLACVLACVLAGACLVPAGASARPTLGNWDLAARRQVVRAGLMSNLAPSNFAGAERLSGGQANGALGALARLMARTASFGSPPTATVTTT